MFRLGDAMLRIVRSKSRPLLHLMRCWSLVAPHLVEVGVGEKMGMGARDGRAETDGEGSIALKMYINPQHYVQFCLSPVAVLYILCHLLSYCHEDCTSK